jgi:tetratricopeptide (TPR) repeat protein
MADPRACRKCQKPGSQHKCPCNGAHYCSGACQQADFQSHKLECEATLTNQLNKLLESNGADDLRVGEKYMELANAQTQHGNFDDAHDNMMVAVRINQADSCSFKTAKLYAFVGDLMVRIGWNKQAISTYKLCRKCIGRVPAHPEHDNIVIWALNGLARAYQAQIRDTLVVVSHAEWEYETGPGLCAIRYAQQALDLNQHDGGLDEIHSELIIGSVLVDQFDLAAGTEKLEECYQRIQLVPSSTQSDLLVVELLSSLGGIYSIDGKPLDQAVHTFNKALVLARRVNGKKHPVVGKILLSVADLVRRQGNTNQAYELYKKAHKICRSALGDDSGSVGKALLGIACVHQVHKNYPKAIKRFDEGAAVLRRTTNGNESDVYHILITDAAIQRQACLDALDH